MNRPKCTLNFSCEKRNIGIIDEKDAMCSNCYAIFKHYQKTYNISWNCCNNRSLDMHNSNGYYPVCANCNQNYYIFKDMLKQ